MALGGCLGNDSLGQKLKQGLEKEGVIADYLVINKEEHSGVAGIIINKGGDKSIVRVYNKNCGRHGLYPSHNG